MKSRTVQHIGLISIALTTSLGSLLWGQAETGQIVGTVRDATGAVVPGAKVTVKGVATGTERSEDADTKGSFTFTNLQPQFYEVTVEAKGFGTLAERAEVAVGAKVGLDIKLEVSAVAATVEVTGSSATVAVNTETQTVSQVLETRSLTELPTISRSPYSLVVTSGNVSEDDPSGRGVGVAMNGLRSAGTNVLLDGVANNDEFTASVGQTVPLDSVQELGIITNNFTAEYGRASAGIVNVTTKSGSNAYHGSAYEFNRVDTRVAANQVIPVNGNLPGRPSEGTNSFGIFDFSKINVDESYLNPITGDADFGPWPGNFTGRDYFHTPGTWNLDLGMYKNAKISERVNLQLRLEAYDAINHANFGINTGSAYIYGGSGLITGSYGGNRNVQLGARVTF